MLYLLNISILALSLHADTSKHDISNSVLKSKFHINAFANHGRYLAGHVAPKVIVDLFLTYIMYLFYPNPWSFSKPFESLNGCCIILANLTALHIQNQSWRGTYSVQVWSRGPLKQAASLFDELEVIKRWDYTWVWSKMHAGILFYPKSPHIQANPNPRKGVVLVKYSSFKWEQVSSFTDQYTCLCCWSMNPSQIMEITVWHRFFI